MKDAKRIALVCSQRYAQCAFDEDGRLIDIDFLPGVLAQLVDLESRGHEIHVIALTERPQDDDELVDLVPATWRAHAIRNGRDCGAWRSLLKKLGERTLLVADDRSFRAAATDADLRVASSLGALEAGLVSEASCFVRLTGDVRGFARRGRFLPWFIETRPDGSQLAFGEITRAALAEAVVAGLEASVLPLDLAREDALMVQIDERDAAAREALTGLRVLWSDGRRALVVLRADMHADEIGLHGAHGHFFALAPNPDLLRPDLGTDRFAGADEVALAQLPLERFPVERIVPDLPILIRPPLCPINAAGFQDIVDRYSGAAPLDGGGAIVSRHSRHPDNARAVDALVEELNGMGYCAFRHSFVHDGSTRQNVIADLPGRGRFAIDPGIWKKLRRVLERKNARVLSRHDWLDEVAEILGEDWVEKKGLRELHPAIARQRVEYAVLLRPWFPWRFRLCPLLAPGADLVIVGCHMDSTAASSAGYDPLTDSAPGADDDASGIAAVLSMARWFRNHYRGKLRHTLRFCFFNAEESGLIGSKAYAAHLKACHAPVRAVVCADMIGYNSDAHRIFEIHAGYTDPAVRDASDPYANVIDNWAATLGSVGPAQIYRGTSPYGGPDRDAYDGAINRSDHAAFHEQGYPAVLVSEDFFANLPAEPGNDPNPNYHRQQDTVIDADYAADIVCATAQAVREIAH